MTDGTTFAVLDAVEQGNLGMRQRMVGDIYVTPSVDPLREIRLDGGVYQRSEWPLIADKFAPPFPVVTGFTQIGDLMSVGTADNTQQNGRLIYGAKSNVLHVIQDYNTNTQPRRSMDGGVTWTLTGLGGLTDINSTYNPIIDALYNEDTFLMVRQNTAGNGFSLERSIDHGTTWNNVLTGSYVRNDSQQAGDMYNSRHNRGSLSYIDGAWYFVTQPADTANALRLYKSVDDGLTWTTTIIPLHTAGYLYPQMFKLRGMYVFLGRVRDSQAQVNIVTSAPDLTGFVNRGTKFLTINDSYQRSKFIQVGNNLAIATGQNGLGSNLSTYTLDTAFWAVVESPLTNISSGYSVRIAPIGPYDAMSFTSTNPEGTNYAWVQYYRDTSIQSLTNLNHSRVNPTGGVLSVTGFPQSSKFDATHDIIGDGKGLVLVKLGRYIYRATAAYLNTFQVGNYFPSSSVEYGSVNATNSNSFYGVIKGKL